jgi:hypothetical protein
MQGPQNLSFAADPNINYKVISALEPTMSFTLQDNTHRLILTTYHGAPNQLFKIYQNNNKYALVNPQLISALHIEGENQNDGGVVKADAGQHGSSYFEILPVTKGEWAGKACHLGTFAQGKALDIKGGKPNQNADICQWKFHGQGNQTWLIIPADEPQKTGQTEHPEEHPEVPADFQPKPNTFYKVVSVMNDEKVLTVGKDNILHLDTFKKEANQKFSLSWDKNKYALVVASTKGGLCIFQDKKDNGAQITTDAGTHLSSWFEIVRHDKGKWAKKAYIIKTHSNGMALDVAGGKPEDGKNVLQYKIHGGDNQLWLFEPFAEEKVKKDKKVAKEPEQPDVEAHFHANPQATYKFLPILNKKFALTVTKDNKLEVEKDGSKPKQLFTIHAEQNKFGIVSVKAKAGLCVFQDKQDNAAEIILDGAKHTSSYFEIVRANKGPFANKGYIIKNYAGNKALDVSGGQIEAGKPVIQYNIHEGGNQVWLIVPHKEGQEEEPTQQGQGWINYQQQGPQQGQGFNWAAQFHNVKPLFPHVNFGQNVMGFHQRPHFKPNQHYILYAYTSSGQKAIDISQNQQNYGQAIIYSFHGAPNQRFTFEAEG